jgi:16S rRNA (guanine1516-N2)-methyltransferase
MTSMMISPFPIAYSEEGLADNVSLIAQQYGFQCNQQALPRLQLTPNGLYLLVAGFSPLQVDFSAAGHGPQLGKTHALIRACKPTPGLRILDVTGGWGRDAALLAHAGAHVLLIERQAVMAALLADGLARLRETSLHLSLVHADARLYLQHLAPEEYPDVIYIDPMHPIRQKSALVKKDMQALQQLFGADDDAQVLIQLALTRARKKVVVKWPQRLPPLIKPHHQISGKTVRFDIYHCDNAC